MLDSRGKTKGGWFFILGFNMLKPNMSNTISIGTCSSDLYIHYFFETSGTASCGTTGIRYDIYIYICLFLSVWYVPGIQFVLCCGANQLEKGDFC